MTVWEAVLGASALAAGAGAWLRSARDGDAPYLSVQRRWLVRASLPGVAPSDRQQQQTRARTRRRALLRDLRRLVPAPWTEGLQPVPIRLQGSHAARPVSIARGWELDLYASGGGFWGLQRRVAGFGALALLLSAAAGRVASLHRAAPPEGAYDPAVAGRGGAAVLGARWYAASLVSPDVHPFRTATPMGPAATSDEPPVATSTTWSGHTNQSPYPHSNTAFTHSNSDTRPFSGPL